MDNLMIEIPPPKPPTPGYVGEAHPEDRFGVDEEGSVYLIAKDSKSQAKLMHEPETNRDASLLISSYYNRHTAMLRWQ
jgi:hypothetical protein